MENFLAAIPARITKVSVPMVLGGTGGGEAKI
jgi:hypothetical protein